MTAAVFFESGRALKRFRGIIYAVIAVKKIMIVDDKPQIRDLLKLELEDDGHQVIVCEGGREALDTLEEMSYGVNIVLLDIKMPEIDGLAVLSAIKQKKKDLPVILLTAYHTFKQDFQSWAAEEYVVKKSDFTELKQKISKYI